MFSLFALIFLGKGEGRADERDNSYTVHPPKLSAPSGDPGEIRRIVMQFYNWTLICDENRKLRQGICNVTQAIHDQEGNTIFSWSLVSTKDGQAVMLLRALPSADMNVPIKLSFPGVKKPILVHYAECSSKLCLAQLPLEAALSAQIERDGSVRISYQVKGGKVFSFTAPFKGLKDALSFSQE